MEVRRPWSFRKLLPIFSKVVKYIYKMIDLFQKLTIAFLVLIGAIAVTALVLICIHWVQDEDQENTELEELAKDADDLTERILAVLDKLGLTGTGTG